LLSKPNKKKEQGRKEKEFKEKWKELKGKINPHLS
jgi:hypothetical protein